MSVINHKTGCTSNGVHLYYGWFEAMHTRMDVLLVGRSEAEATGLVEEAYSEIKRLEGRFNRFDPQSDLSKINRREYDDWGSGGDLVNGRLVSGGFVNDDLVSGSASAFHVAPPLNSATMTSVTSTPLSDFQKETANTSARYCVRDVELVKIFSEAERYKELTEGMFNIAIQTQSFKSDRSYYTIDIQRETLLFPDSQAIFDFGGYAKGYALERMSQHLRVAGVTSALISFGNSSVVAIGRHPTGKMWEVCVDHPTNKGLQLATVEMEDCAMSTSGNTPDNRGHIRSSITAEGITDSRLVTVKATSALDCEVLSTALFAAQDRTQQERIIANFSGAKFLEMKY